MSQTVFIDLMFIFASFGYVCGAGKRLYDTKDKSNCPN